jgi:hypothetical protein
MSSTIRAALGAASGAAFDGAPVAACDAAPLAASPGPWSPFGSRGTDSYLLFTRVVECCNARRHFKERIMSKSSTQPSRRAKTAVLAAWAAIAVAMPAAANGPEVAYPKGYREWTHVKSMVIQPGHALFDAFGGIHHLYANKKALAGYRAGGKFADGSVIVFDLLDAKSADNTVQEGARKVVGVMVKDARRYAATGGWGFEGFKGDSTTERAVGQKNAATACFQCHQAKKDNDFVFSAWRP